MNKKTFITIFAIVGLTIISYELTAKQNKREPVTFTESSLLRELTIDDKIKEAQVIVIGEARTTLPSKWKFHNEKDTRNATPQEIFDAGGLFTDSLLSIDQTLKGNIGEPIIRVRSFFGETEQIRWEDSSQLSYSRGHLYLLFLSQDNGPAANVDPGYYRSVNANTAVYEIIDGKAISGDGDEWLLEDLITYIKNSLSAESSSPTSTPIPADLSTPSPTSTPIPTDSLVETPLPFTDTPVPTDLPTQTPLPTETTSPTP